MAITVRFPAMLHAIAGPDVTVAHPVSTIGELLPVLFLQVPGLAGHLADPIYNFAVNDELVLHGVNARPLRDGDVVELVPTIAGG